MRDTTKGGKPRNRKKSEKGGPRKFVSSEEELALRNTAERGTKDQDSSDDGSEDELNGIEEGNEIDDDEDGVTFEREALKKSLFSVSSSMDGPIFEKTKKKTGVAAIIQIENPNLKSKQTTSIKAKDMDASFEHKLTRKEREAIDHERAASEYMRRHLAGETTEAKKDLARLAEVRRRREVAEIRRKETEEAEEVLDARAIKALKPAVLKDKLKERGLSTQGQKKDLVQRLIDHENERSL
uniref:Uncharacterized protein AlNc14C365G11045 n=1 Tax=Albugo laibachii Nc14 TaxID=890382 RepID=F0WXV8_9STRA|nr:conserved hypothetical protein [Albugo laibachii Nc14]|eukprot:CCA26306.1 conserved hypothetical protein [Albugo laibachii Nc14]